MIADALLANGFQRLLVAIQIGRGNRPQIVFDDALVLGGWRHETRVEDCSFGIEFVAMIKQAARRFSARIANTVARLGRNKGRGGGS